MVTSLVLVGPSVSGVQPSELIRRFMADEDTALEQGDLEAATELNLRMWVDGPKRRPEQVKPSVRKQVHDMQYHSFTVPIPEEAQEISLQPPAILRLAEICVLTLLMVGDYDIPDKQVLTRQIAEQIPNAQHVVIPGVAHMVNMEQPERFNQLVLTFLKHV